MLDYNGTQYCSTETVLLIFSFLQTNITSQKWPSGGKNTHRSAKSRDRQAPSDPTDRRRSTCDGDVRRQSVSVDPRETQHRTPDHSQLPSVSHLGITINSTAQVSKVNVDLHSVSFVQCIIANIEVIRRTAMAAMFILTAF